jgi:hypothetical protein
MTADDGDGHVGRLYMKPTCDSPECGASVPGPSASPVELVHSGEVSRFCDVHCLGEHLVENFPSSVAMAHETVENALQEL